MTHYLTKKGRPGWVRLALEALLVLAVLVWTATGVYVFFDEFIHDLQPLRLLAFAITLGLPLLLMMRILLAWRRRGLASSIAKELAHCGRDTMDWEQLRFCCPIARLEETVELLLDKGYLCNIATGQDGVCLQREPAPVWPVPQEHRCPACGEAMKKRTWGDWACRRCGHISQ